MNDTQDRDPTVSNPVVVDLNRCRRTPWQQRPHRNHAVPAAATRATQISMGLTYKPKWVDQYASFEGLGGSTLYRWYAKRQRSISFEAAGE